jgi:predicted O-linked N-acetylglucosamine transferase (SPINDLY family)
MRSDACNGFECMEMSVLVEELGKSCELRVFLAATWPAKSCSAAGSSWRTTVSDLGPDAAALLASALDLLRAQQPVEAAAVLLRAREQAPDHPAILEPLAEAYCRNGQLLAGLHVYDRLIELNLATSATWCATGNALVDVGEYAQAIGAYQRSLALEPVSPEARHNLARARYRLGEVSAAVDDLERCTAQCDDLQPWLSLATIIPGCPAASAERIGQVRAEFGKRLAAGVRAPGTRRPARRKRSGPLCVGYLSAYFHRANYMKPVWGLVNHHDRAALRVCLFSDSPPQAGMPGYRPHPSDRVFPSGGLSNEELAASIEQSGIEVLVDLNAYSVPERLALFVHRICPVTTAWFNMYATSGLPAFDYLVGDAEVVRPEEEPFYRERILRLPVSYLTFQVDYAVPEVVDPPCLRAGQVTFGSLVSQYKITPGVLDAWAAILRAAPNSRLLLANAALQSIHNRQYLCDAFAQRGVGHQRLELRGPAEHLAFLGNYHDIDVALDCFPYNGGTTTMEAIWQGVPVLALEGDRWAARTSQSLLRCCDLGRFLAADRESYVALAARLASDRATPDHLHELRRTMRDRLLRSSACDTRTLARGMEDIFRQTTAGCW